MQTHDKRKGAIHSNFKGARVLVVDDNPDHQTIIGKAMHSCLPEVEVIQAQTVEEAMAFMNAGDAQEWGWPKLVLLDLYLPEREAGWRLLQQIRSMPGPASKTPVVLLSSSNESDDVTESYRRGVSSYLVKPHAFADWLVCFRTLRSYWWETVTLLPVNFYW